MPDCLSSSITRECTSWISAGTYLAMSALRSAKISCRERDSCFESDSSSDRHFIVTYSGTQSICIVSSASEIALACGGNTVIGCANLISFLLSNRASFRRIPHGDDAFSVESRTARSRCLSRNSAAMGTARHHWLDRHKVWMWHGAVRRLHGARGWYCCPFMLNSDFDSGRQKYHHD